MSKDFNFDDHFLSVDSQEKGSAFEVVNDNGDPTGMFITLAGPDSSRRSRTQSRVKDFYLKAAMKAQKAEPDNRKARRAAISHGEKNNGEVTTELRSLQMADMVAATISWTFPDGVKGMECTPDNVENIYSKHPTLLEQVLEVADNLERFTKS